MSLNILPFRVYQLLLEYTDADHALPMGELLRLLRTEYGLRRDRRTVYTALDSVYTNQAKTSHQSAMQRI